MNSLVRAAILTAAAAMVVAPPSQGSSARSREGETAAPDRADVQQSADEVGQYEKLELTVRVGASYANPFDPEQVDIAGIFTTPSGRTLRVPGFYSQPYRRSRDEERNETLERSGGSSFKLRFAWGEVGVYRFQVVARDAQGQRTLGDGSFAVRPSSSPGYVRCSAAVPAYLQFDSGASYFAIGENLCWPNDPGTYNYDRWMNRLQAAGANYLRLWLANEWNELGLEHLSRSSRDGNGLGRYDQEAAWRVDYVVDLAEQTGLRALMCIESFNSLDASGLYAMWQRYPYNAANGGPCANPRDFFTDPQARQLFKQRLRYLVARWGYSTAVLAWELWNEVDLTTGYDSAAVAAWHSEMARYLRSIDPWEHPITTSFADTRGDPAVDRLAELELVQSHSYGSHDIAETLSRVCRDKAEVYGKPHYVSEFGAHWLPDENASDPDGIHLHNGLWSSMLSRGAGTAMVWWWDGYVDPRDLYYHFAAVAAFAGDINWVQENYRPANITELRWAPDTYPSSYPTLDIVPVGESWEDGSPYNQPRTFRVENDRPIESADLLSRIHHGLIDSPAWHNPATFELEYPMAGRFEVIVEGVSGYGGAALVISLDGTRAVEAHFPDTDEGSTDDMHQYDGTYGIDVPPGRHTIVVENTGADWFSASYRLTNYITVPNLRILALSNSRSALAWVQNREHTWWNHRNGLAPRPVGRAEIVLRGFHAGRYQIEQWDTYKGTIASKSEYVCSDGEIVLVTPAGLTEDVAYKIRTAGTD